MFPPTVNKGERKWYNEGKQCATIQHQIWVTTEERISWTCRKASFLAFRSLLPLACLTPSPSSSAVSLRSTTRSVPKTGPIPKKTNPQTCAKREVEDYVSSPLLHLLSHACTKTRIKSDMLEVECGAAGGSKITGREKEMGENQDNSLRVSGWDIPSFF